LNNQISDTKSLLETLKKANESNSKFTPAKEGETTISVTHFVGPVSGYENGSPSRSNTMFQIGYLASMQKHSHLLNLKRVPTHSSKTYSAKHLHKNLFFKETKLS
jgi:hypothetical protein